MQNARCSRTSSHSSCWFFLWLGALRTGGAVLATHRPVFLRALKQPRAFKSVHCSKTQAGGRASWWLPHLYELMIWFPIRAGASEPMGTPRNEDVALAWLMPLGQDPWAPVPQTWPSSTSNFLSSPVLFKFALQSTQCFHVSVRTEALLHQWCPDLFNVFT